MTASTPPPEPNAERWLGPAFVVPPTMTVDPLTFEDWRSVILADPGCDCDVDPHHRWNCPMTPIWAQTIRDLDTNPWTVVTRARGGLIGAPYCQVCFTNHPLDASCADEP